MKKILFLINTLGIGGAEKALIDIVNNMDPKKFDITIKTIYDINKLGLELKPHVRYETLIKNINSNFFSKIKMKIGYWLMKMPAEKIYRLIIRKQYDIEVAFLEGLPTKIISASSSDSVKIAWVHCNMEDNHDSDYFFKSLSEQRDSYLKFNKIFCVSDLSTEEFIKRFNIKENVYTIHNIIDKKEIVKKSKEPIEDGIFKKDVFNFITVGRHTKQKGYPRLIECYSEYRKDSKINSHLYLIGDGEERSLIEETIRMHSLQENVTLLGNQTNPYKYIKRADLFVSSSFSEGYGLTIMESLAVGTPVLATEISRKAIFNEKLVKTVKNDKKSIIEGLKFMSTSTSIEKYRKSIEENYSKYENTIEGIEDMILK